MVTYNGVNHLAMATGDMDSTIRFWRDLLGMRLVAGLGRPGFRHYFFELSDTDLVAFFEWPDIKPVPHKDHGEPVRGPFIFDHVSFGVDTEADLWELKDKLEAAGFDVSEVIDHGFIHSIYSFDPNGIPIEFSVNVPGRDVRKNPTIVDANPSNVTLEGPEPLPDKWPEVKTPTPNSMKRCISGPVANSFMEKRKRSRTLTPTKTKGTAIKHRKSRFLLIPLFLSDGSYGKSALNTLVFNGWSNQ